MPNRSTLTTLTAGAVCEAASLVVALCGGAIVPSKLIASVISKEVIRRAIVCRRQIPAFISLLVLECSVTREKREEACPLSSEMREASFSPGPGTLSWRRISLLLLLTRFTFLRFLRGTSLPRNIFSKSI